MIAALVLAVFPSAAGAYVNYAGPKTWAPGWAGNTGYDNSTNRWYWNGFTEQSTGYFVKLIAFIKSDGSWPVSVENDFETTYYYYDAGTFNYQKKAYCKNTSGTYFFGFCQADADPP
jgi:hypothetical protein